MSRTDRFRDGDIKHLQAIAYLIPVLGFLPSLWTLYRRRGSREQRVASRLAVILTLGWMFGYLLLGAGAQTADALSLPLLVMSSFLTSGYFLVNIWLMARLWQRKSLWLPGVSQLGDRLP